MKKTTELIDKIYDINAINPVDFYNRNCVEDVIELLCSKKSIERVGATAITYVKNRADKNKRMVVVDPKTNMFTAELPNGFDLMVGEEFTPFMMLQKFIFRDSFREALSYVIYEKMGNKNNYIRIQTKYYKKIKKTDRWGIEREVLSYWERVAIVDDYGKDMLSNIEKYDDFVIEPDNKNYKRIIKNCYNVYNPFSHSPAEDYEGEHQWKWTKILLKHIFGEDHYDLGIEYVKVLYDDPRQALPILTLVSKERQTGKTTFVNWITILFGANTVIINPQDISNSFNGSYASKNIIMIEESHFDSRQTIEKIKNLATQKEINVNSKFVQQYQIPFFGKLIITSNDETKFTTVPEEEIRFWIRTIPTLKGKANHEIMDDLTKEIPYFLAYLNTLPPVKIRSRMVFTEEEIDTKILQEVKKESRETLHKDLEQYLDEIAENNPQVEVFCFLAQHVKEKWFKYHQRFSVSYINRVLKTNMNFPKSDKSMRYIPLETRTNALDDKVVGKPYLFQNPYYDPASTIEEDELEF